MKTTLSKSFAKLAPPSALYNVFHMAFRWLDQFGWVPTGVTSYLGHPFVYPLDSGIGRQIASGEEWDAILGTIISTLLLMDEPSICEVGSNIGASLIQIARVKPLAHILSFEPSDRFRPFLERNLKQAEVVRVEISPLLVGRKMGIIQLYNNNTSASVTLKYDRGSRGHRKGPRRKQSVIMTTLDEVFQQRSHVDFIKVDTDGFDLEVIGGAQETLKRDSPILYFELFPAACQVSAPIDGLRSLQNIDYYRFICFTPIGKYLGITDNAEQALVWAHTHGYCDMLVTRAGSLPEAQIEKLISQLESASSGVTLGLNPKDRLQRKKPSPV